MAKAKEKLTLLHELLQRRARQDRAAWESAQLVLDNKRQEQEHLLRLRTDYQDQLRNFSKGPVPAVQDRMQIYGSLGSLTQALTQELAKLERLAQQSHNTYRQTLAKQRGIERLLEARNLEQQQLQRRRDRANGR